MDDKYLQEGPFSYDDGAFTVFKTRWGTWGSADKEGKRLVCGNNRESVEFFSREKLDGYPNCYTTDTGVSTETKVDL